MIKLIYGIRVYIYVCIYIISKYMKILFVYIGQQDLSFMNLNI